ncbi:MAG: hypothetical protein HY818_11170 [Acetobacterium woodii]|nr:hypothetical protein [Acetobacterium woodii]
MKRKKFIIGIMAGIFVLVLVALLCFSSSLAGLRSDWVLQAQGASFETTSVFHQAGLELAVPTSARTGDNRWCKHIKLYHCGENFPHQGAGELSILYNFGSFNDGRSAFYNPESDTFNAHYGVYAIHQTDRIFGYQNGAVDVKAITDLVAFDQLELVMTSLGCPAALKHFDAQITAIQPGPTMAGFSDWVQLDAVIQTNAPLYQERDFQLGTLQYGHPPDYYAGPDFPVVSMVGRLYLRYDQPRQLTMIYFVIGKDAAMVEATSTDYLKPIKWLPANQK